MAISITGTVDAVPPRTLSGNRVSDEVLEIEEAVAALNSGQVLAVSFEGATGEGADKDTKRAAVRAVTLRKRGAADASNPVAGATSRGVNLYVTRK